GDASRDGLHRLVKRKQRGDLAVVERRSVGGGCGARYGGLEEVITAESGDHGEGQGCGSNAALGGLGGKRVHTLLAPILCVRVFLFCLSLLPDHLQLMN